MRGSCIPLTADSRASPNLVLDGDVLARTTGYEDPATIPSWKPCINSVALPDLFACLPRLQVAHVFASLVFGPTGSRRQRTPVDYRPLLRASMSTMHFTLYTDARALKSRARVMSETQQDPLNISGSSRFYSTSNLVAGAPWLWRSAIRDNAAVPTKEQAHSRQPPPLSLSISPVTHQRRPPSRLLSHPSAGHRSRRRHPSPSATPRASGTWQSKRGCVRFPPAAPR